MANDPTPILDEAEEARAEERIDPARLRPFLATALPGADLAGLEVLQFRKGHSNLTYLVRAGGREAVLRRAPFGARIKHAHDMRREFQLLAALHAAYDRAPRPIAFWYAHERAGRIFDGADEVHVSAVAKRILRRYGLRG